MRLRPTRQFWDKNGISTVAEKKAYWAKIKAEREAKKEAKKTEKK